MQVLRRFFAVFLAFACLSMPSHSQTFVLAKDGKIEPTRLANFVTTMEPFLGNWPPKFKDQSDRSMVEETMRQVFKEVQSQSLSPTESQATLANVGYLYVMGHNLDLDRSYGGRARQLLLQALSLNPNDRKTNYRLGMFLISTKAFHSEALPYLQKAHELGESQALFSIGLFLIRKGEKEKGLAALRAYAEQHPGDTHARKVIEAVKSGALSFHEK